MIRSSGVAKTTAVIMAMFAHGALAVGVAATETAKTEGAGTTADVRLGSTFKDLAAGTIHAQAPSRATAPITPSTPSTPSETPQKITAHKPDLVRPAPDLRQRTLSAAQIQANPAHSPEKIPPTVKPKVAQARPETDHQRITGNTPETHAVTRDVRPKTRPTPKSAPQTTSRQSAAKAKATIKGNSDRNARAGEATGNIKSIARKSGSGGRQSAGNSAASNYPGLVMRKISRVGKPRVNARGATVVAFSIAGNGRLASVSVARSSGSSTLDRAAVRLVQRAAPFPTPPHGAQRRFSIRIKGQ